MGGVGYIVCPTVTNYCMAVRLNTQGQITCVRFILAIATKHGSMFWRYVMAQPVDRPGLRPESFRGFCSLIETLWLRLTQSAAVSFAGSLCPFLS